MRPRAPLIIFLVFFLINSFIFLQRQHFEYKSYPGKSFLYHSAQQGHWSRYLEDYPAEDREAAARILDTLPWQEDTRSNILVLAAFLQSRFETRKGVPSLALQTLTPAKQFARLCTDTAETIWCGTWSNLFNYFAWNRGFISRIVETNQPGDHHVFNEVWLPDEKQWALVDLTNNFLFPQNREGQYLNAISLAGTAKISPVRAYTVEQGETVLNDSMYLEPAIVDYYTCDYPFHYYERYRLEKIYSARDRAIRYLLPRPWYHIMSHNDAKPGNGWFYVKQSAIIILFLSLVWLGRVTITRRKRAEFERDSW